MSNFWERKNISFTSPTGLLVPTVFSVLWDDTTRIFHVLDEDSAGSRSVTNAMNYQFVNFLFRLCPIGKGSRIFLYGTDGVIVEYAGSSFAPLAETDYKKIHDPYVKKNRSSCLGSERFRIVGPQGFGTCFRIAPKGSEYKKPKPQRWGLFTVTAKNTSRERILKSVILLTLVIIYPF